MVNVLKSFSVNPRFRVKDTEGKSSYRRQREGIRQGSPPSQYLFVLVMTCIEKDISREVTQQVKDARIPGTAFDIVFCAADTIVVSRTKEACEELLDKC